MNKTTDEIMKQIEELVAASNTQEEAIAKICEAFPEANAEKLKKAFAEEEKKAREAFAKNNNSEEVETLSEDALEEVAGGSFGSWMKKNWPTVLATAAGLAMIGTAAYFGYKSKAVKNARQEGYKNEYSWQEEVHRPREQAMQY